MKFKKVLSTILTLGVLSLNANADSRPIKYIGPTYEIRQGEEVYRGTRCTTEGVTGWCISDSNKNFITETNQYSDLAFSFEAMKEAHDMAKSVSDSKKAFDSAFNAQLLMNIAKFAVDNLPETGGSLLSKIYTGGLSKTADIQKEMIKEGFKEKQKEVFFMVSDKTEKFYDDLINGRITEEELKTKIKDEIYNSYGYQLKLASSELGRFQKLNQKANKTPEEYRLMRQSMIDGLSRGYMASAALNVINESRTINKSIKSILNGLARGSGLDSIINKFAEETGLEDTLNFDFLENNPDFERALVEGQKMFETFNNPFMDYNKYWDAKKEGTNASKLIDLLNNTKSHRRRDANIQKESVKPLDNSSEIRKQRELERQRAREQERIELERNNRPKIIWPDGRKFAVQMRCTNSPALKSLPKYSCIRTDPGKNEEVCSDELIQFINKAYNICINDNDTLDYRIVEYGDNQNIIGVYSEEQRVTPNDIINAANKIDEDTLPISTPKNRQQTTEGNSMKIVFNCAMSPDSWWGDHFYGSSSSWCSESECFDYNTLISRVLDQVNVCSSNPIQSVIKINDNPIRTGNYHRNSIRYFLEEAEMIRTKINDEEFLKENYPRYEPKNE